MQNFKIKSVEDLVAFEAVPLRERLTITNVYDWIRHGAALDPGLPAIVALGEDALESEPRTLSYGEVLTGVRQVANLLWEFGVRSRDAVALMLPAVPEMHVAMWGTEAAGVACPINPALASDHIVSLMKAAGCKVLISAGPQLDPAIWQKVEEIRQQSESALTVFLVGDDVTEDVGLYDFNRRVQASQTENLISGRVFDGNDIAAYFHTGGTTGIPKLTIQTHQAQVYQSWVLGFHTGYRPGDRILMGLPLFHTAGLIHNGLSLLGWGATIVLLHPQGFRHKPVVENFWRIVEKYRGVHYMGVPTVQTSLLANWSPEIDISSLRSTVSGAAPASKELIEALRNKLNVNVIEGYGLTEATCACTLNPIDGEKMPGSIGIRLAYEELKIATLDESGVFKRDCQPGEVGSILVKGVHVSPGYVGGQPMPMAAPGWLDTGDLGRQDQRGYVYIAGRTKDLIIRSGHNIEPAVVEQALYAHPAVLSAAAVGLPDVYAGELPLAFVTLQAGSAASGEELAAFARLHIKEKGASPVEVIVLEEMPTTVVGKIFKPPLRLLAVQRAVERAIAGKLARPDLIGGVHARANEAGGAVAVMTLAQGPEVDLAQAREQTKAALSGFNFSVVFE